MVLCGSRQSLFWVMDISCKNINSAMLSLHEHLKGPILHSSHECHKRIVNTEVLGVKMHLSKTNKN